MIAGVDPKQPGYVRTISTPVYKRMEICYNARRKRYEQTDEEAIYGDEVISVESDHMLKSSEMDSRASHAEPDNDQNFLRWLGDHSKSGVEVQRFTREELTRWLGAIGIPSKYQFAAPQLNADEKPICQWPWGAHHTKRLGHLEAAARRFWVNYDQTDPTTAPTNESVSDWLRSERKLSKAMADSMASILRADGLPTGPRK